MLNWHGRLGGRPTARPSKRKAPFVSSLHLIAASVILALSLQLACLSKKHQTTVFPASPVRIAFLPFDAPVDDDKVQWTALEAPIMMAKISEHTDSLEVVPLWESMPVVKEAAGPFRDITQEVAASVAGWLAAKWSVMGVVSHQKDAVSVTIDFIPAKSSLIPFRYQTTSDLDSVSRGFRQSLEQFLSYLVANPLSEGANDSEHSMSSFRSLAEALDREYGWFGDTEPGESAKVVSGLVRSDRRLARLLFNPSLYPVMSADKAPGPKSK